MGIPLFSETPICLPQKNVPKEMPLIACSGDTGGVLGKTTHLGKELKLRAIGHLGPKTGGWGLNVIFFFENSVKCHGCGELISFGEERVAIVRYTCVCIYIYSN